MDPLARTHAFLALFSRVSMVLLVTRLLLLHHVANGSCQPDIVTCVTEFYPFGQSENDNVLANLDDVSSQSIMLSEAFYFYGQAISIVYIGSNGIISLNTQYNPHSVTSLPIGELRRFIAPYWGDVDTTGTGQIYYRQTTNSTLLARAANEIQTAFSVSQNVSSLFIATWNAVGYFRRMTDMINTFQCVLATSAPASFVIFLYADGEIQWTNGALAGINAGDGVNSITIPGSRTQDIINISQTSNVGIPGIWMFQVNGVPTVTVTTGNMLRTLILEWEPPSSPGGIFTTYMVTYNDTTVDTSNNDTNYTITGLDPYTNYSITVSACTSNGCGNQSDVVIGTTAEEAPNPPLNVNASTISSTAVRVSWNPPDITNGIIRYYTVVYRLNDSSQTMELNSTDVTVVVTNLDPFNHYLFYVLAFTVASSDPSENDTALTAEAAPSAPINVTAHNVSSTSIMVIWQSPMIPNGIVRSYRVELTRIIDRFIDDITTTNTSVVIVMLEKFTIYDAQVFATTVTEGDGSDIATVTTDEDTPGIPGDLFVNEINSTAITVSWVQPAVTNGIITMYEIFYSLGNHSVLDDDATVVPFTATVNTSYQIIIGGLDHFTIYTVAMRAFTRIGSGSLTETFSILTDPFSSSPPQNFTIKVLNATAVKLSWQYPNSPNGEIRGYSILYAEFPTIVKILLNITLATINDPSNQTAMIAGLAPFTQYSFRVRAFSFGDQNERPDFIHIGIATEEIIVRTNENVPEAPTNFMVKAISSTEMEILWNAPDVTNGILLYYTVVYSNSTDTLMVVYNSEAFNETIIDLNEDTLYSFIIYANTSAGAGPNATDFAVTFEDRPSAPPQNVTTVVINSTAILISWDPPPFLDQNGDIISYQLKITDQNRTAIIANVNMTSYVATMLQKFEVYSIEITAETIIGLGPFSEPVNNQTFEDVPSMEPQNVSIFTILSRSFMLSWNPPLIGEQNGILICYHVIVIETQIRYTDDGAKITGNQRYLNRTYNTSKGCTQLIDMLHPDYNYTVRIAAATEPGIGPFSNAVTVRMEMDVPTEAPIIVSVTVNSSRSIMLTWERPSPKEENGLLVCYHVIIIETQIYHLDNGKEISLNPKYLNRTYNVSEGRTQLIDMLHPDYNYTVRIAAATEPGIGPFSNAVTVRMEMDVPTEAPITVSVTVNSSRSIMLTWERPSPKEENGLLVCYHVIIIEIQIYHLDNGTEISLNPKYLNRTYNVSEGRTQLIDMLHPDYNYTVRIAAATEPGIGPFSDAITIRTYMDVPTETPRNISITVNSSHSIILSWERPSPEEENGLLFIYHVIVIETQIYHLDNGTVISRNQTHINRTYNVSEGRTQLIDMLHPDYNYTVRIAAATEPGIGPFSDVITVRTYMDVPKGSPQNFSVTPINYASVFLSWDRPIPTEENGIIIMYIVTYNGSRVEKQPDNLPDKLIHYGEFSIQLSNIPRETYITNMSTLVSNSKYQFAITASTINGSGPASVHDIVMIDQEIDVTLLGLNLTRSFASVTLLEGNKLNLSCTPSINEIVLSWTHNGTNVNEDENTTLLPVNLNHNLILDNTDVDDSGQYTCHAILDDEVVEQSITVTVVADSDKDGFPDESLDCSEPFCSKDVCPDIYSVTEDDKQSITFCQEINVLGGCPFGPDEVWNITWPATNASTTARQKCPGSSEAKGIATRQCNQNGDWEAPDVSQCTTVEQIRLEMRAEKLNTLVANLFVSDDRDLTEVFMPEVVEDIANELNAITSTSTPLLPNDVTLTANTLNIIILVIDITISEVDQSMILNVIEDAVDILDTLLDPRNDMSFQDISTQSSEEEAGGASVSEQLLMNTEQVGVLLVATINTTNNETMRTISNPNIVIEAQIPKKADLKRKPSIPFPTATSTSTDVSLVFGNMTPMIEIPSAIVLRQLEEGNEVPIINIVARNSRLPTDEGQRVESLILSSQISTNPQRRVFLDGETIQLAFSIGMQENAKQFNPRCAFFRFASNRNESGRFSTEGITTSSTTNSTFVQCTSTHLTSFAVLVDTSGESSDSEALSIVSYIGCAISIACLLFTIAALIALRKQIFNHIQHFLHLNLCIALLLGLAIFVSGIETAAEYRESCLIVAILLHYFFMAAFCWMLSEGVLLFIMLYFVFYKGFFLRKRVFFVIGWGLPLPIIAVSAAVSNEYYGINDRCWISEENGAIWAFIGPMLLIILVNVLLLTVILYQVYKSKQKKMTVEEVSTIESIKALLKAAAIVIPVLGCTWLFGLLAINDNTVVFAWIFTIFNSLQGALIMFFYVLRNDKFLGTIKCQAKDSRSSKTLSTPEKLNTIKGSTLKFEDNNSKALSEVEYVTLSTYNEKNHGQLPVISPNVSNVHVCTAIENFEFDENDEIRDAEKQELSDFTPSRQQQISGIIDPSNLPNEEAKL